MMEHELICALVLVCVVVLVVYGLTWLVDRKESDRDE